MKNRGRFFTYWFGKRGSLILASMLICGVILSVTTIRAFAETGEVPPPDTEEIILEENETDENLDTSKPELNGNPDEPSKEDPEENEVPLFDTSKMLLMMSSSVVGDDQTIKNKLPDFGNNYNQGDCMTNASCAPDEPVTNPNQYTNQGDYGEKKYSLPKIGGNNANVIAIKDGNNWYFFEPGSSGGCETGMPFCVEFDGNDVFVRSYEKQGRNLWSGFNLIHFWYVAGPPPPNGPGPNDATKSDVPEGEVVSLIPVTGLDLTENSQVHMGFTLMILLGFSMIIKGLSQKFGMQDSQP